jgi:hypothetical protein
LAGYRALSPAQTELVFAIWKLETEPDHRGRPITCAEIAEVLDIEASHARKIIAEVEAMSPDYFVNHSVFPAGGTKRRGRPLTAYHLNQEGIVTFPETAFILLELLRFPARTPYRVNRKEFEQYLVGCGIEPVLITDRIDTNIRAGYIREYVGFPGYISPTERIECERDYLERLARGYSPVKRQRT